jgi:hypothetical protein
MLGSTPQLPPRLPEGLPGPLDVPGRVLASIQHEAAGRADVGAHAQTLAHTRATPATVLAGVVGGDRHHSTPGALAMLPWLRGYCETAPSRHHCCSLPGEHCAPGWQPASLRGTPCRSRGAAPVPSCGGSPAAVALHRLVRLLEMAHPLARAVGALLPAPHPALRLRQLLLGPPVVAGGSISGFLSSSSDLPVHLPTAAPSSSPTAAPLRGASLRGGSDIVGDQLSPST